MKKILFLLVFLYPGLLFCNNLQLSNLQVSAPNTAGKYRIIQFDISWENSWRTTSAPFNWDAAWVFLKYRVGTGEWLHATLSTTEAEHTAPTGSTVKPVNDGKGVFIYRNANGSGTFSLTNVGLRWNYATDGVADDANVNFSVLGIEMVYIPQGSFYAGDNAYSYASLKQGSSDNDPWYIQSDSAISVTNTSSNGFYYVSGDKTGEDATGSTFTISAAYPKGYAAIYCMKYEITQEQYADFLNSLTTTQASARYPNQNGSYRHTITYSGGTYTASRSDRACNYLSWADGCAYSDWSGLRPMTELEYEKICRGANQPAVSGEYAWGTTNITAATTISGTENGTERITNSGANCNYYSGNSFTGGDGGQGPLRVGIFGNSSTTREKSGASYYGVMEMSGNLWERAVTIGNSNGRGFTGSHGDGLLTSSGLANVSYWPGVDALGAGFRGGGWNADKFGTCVSVRESAALTYLIRDHFCGFRCVRSAP